MFKKLSVLFLFVLLLFSCGVSRQVTPQAATAITETLSEAEDHIQRSNLTLLAAGDNLFHITLINSYRQGDIYDFSPIYTEIKSLIENTDLAFINQETVMAGGSFGYSGYPLFNTPRSLAETLAQTGFDIVNLANNHAMDMETEGLLATLDFFDTINEFTVIGARRSGESHRIITKNNITLGFLAYTYGLNGFRPPANNPNLVSLIIKSRMSQEINALRPLCDFLIVSMHWGEEYRLTPGEDQKELARFLADHNVDLIIGHHPHVLQPVETLDRPDGGKTLCFYSLGNFVSNQRTKERNLGGLMLVTFTKENSGELPGELYISNSGLIPTVCHFEQGFTNTRVYPLYAYTEELLEKHMLRQLDREMDFGFFNSIIFNLGTKLIMHDPFLSK